MRDGNWITFDTWNKYNGYEWEVPSDFSTSSDANIITTDHNIIVNQTVSVDQLTVNTGKTLTINSGSQLTVQNGTGTDITNNGIITANYTSTSSYGTLFLDGNLTNNGTLAINGKLAIYEGSHTGGVTYGTYSTLEYKGNSKTIGDEYNLTSPKNLSISLNSNDFTVTLTGNRSIIGTLTLYSGILATSDYVLTLGESVGTRGTINRIEGKITGTFKK